MSRANTGFSCPLLVRTIVLEKSLTLIASDGPLTRAFWILLTFCFARERLCDFVPVTRHFGACISQALIRNVRVFRSVPLRRRTLGPEYKSNRQVYTFAAVYTCQLLFLLFSCSLCVFIGGCTMTYVLCS